MTCVEVVSPTKNNAGTIEKDTDGNDVILGDILIHKETILQLEKIMKSIPKTKATVLLNEYVEKSIAERKIIEESSELSSVKLSYLVDDYNLPTSSMKELGAILFGISRLEKRGVVTRTQIRGKNLSSLSSLKKRISALAKQCMVEQPDSPTPTTDSTIKDNDSDDVTSTKNSKDTQQNSSHVGNKKKRISNENPIDMNLDNLTNQVLTLPREFRPIRLSEDNTIRSENASRAASRSVNLPKLPELTAEIFVNNDDDELTVNDEDMTVSVFEASHESEIQSKRKKIESDICKLIDLFKLPQYQKRILPSVESRRYSESLPQENKAQY